MKKKYIKTEFKFIYYTWVQEFRNIFRDPGVMVLLILAPLAYPALYSLIYTNETLHDTPIAVVDNSQTAWSRKFVRSIDATPDVKVTANCLSFKEAKKLYQQRKVHGIIEIPANFEKNIYNHQQAYVSVFTDMSSFLYYKALMMATSFTSKDIGMEIQMQRLQDEGLSEPQASVSAQPFTYTNITLFNPTAGYGSFLLPAVLILIIHQTLLLGIGMANGTEYEKHKKIYLLRMHGKKQSIFSMLLGKMLCYTLLYVALTYYIIGIIPMLFKLPTYGNRIHIMLFILPFLLSTIFFALTLSAFFRSRENSMLLILFSSIPLLFISGISWPSSAIPEFWKIIGWLLPSTHGINGYVKLNTMHANLPQIHYEYLSLWILTGIYFLAAYFIRIIKQRKQYNSKNLQEMRKHQSKFHHLS